MSATVTDVFDIAMGLMDEISSTGASESADTADYRDRTLRIINNLQQELYPLSDSYVVEAAGKRPMLARLAALTDAMSLDDYLTQTVLPYGLAAALLLGENPAVASFFQQRYEELKLLARSVPAAFSAIEDVYGGIEHGQFSRW